MNSNNNWVESFFESPNQLEYEKIFGDGYPEWLQILLKDMLYFAQSNKRPFVLPRLDQENRLWFYVVASNLKELVEIKDVVNSYLGGAYVDIKQKIYNSSEDTLEKKLLEFSIDGFLRFKIFRKEVETKTKKELIFFVMDTLNKIIQQFHQRPKILSNLIRPTNRILRDFFIAYERKDYESCLLYQAELEKNQALSHRNLIFLQYQAFSVGGKWNLILSHPNLSELLRVRVPRRILQIVLNALSNAFLNPDHLNEIEFDSAVLQLQHLDFLFNKLPFLPENEKFKREWCTWVIGAKLFGFNVLLENVPSFIEHDWVSKLNNLLGITQEKIISNQSSSISIINTVSEESLDIAIQLLKMSLSVNEDEKKQIFNKLNSFSETIINQIQNDYWFSVIWNGLKDYFQSEINDNYYIITSWSEYFEYILSNQKSSEALNLLNDFSSEWDTKSWNEELLLNVLGNPNFDNVNIRTILPIIIKWLIERDINLTSKCIVDLLSDLSLDDYQSREDIFLSYYLMDMFLDGRFNAEEYINALDAIDIIWEKVKSLSTIDSMIELLDLLVLSPCGNESSRVNLWLNFQVTLIKEFTRLSKSQKQIVFNLADDLSGNSSQLRELDPDLEVDFFEDIDLQGKKLAIYTLTESAGRRSKELLGILYPGLEVILNHDKTNTSALDNLIKSADFFVFSAKSAAHQAFYPLAKERKDIIYPLGKGSSSIVKAFTDYIQRESLSEAA